MHDSFHNGFSNKHLCSYAGQQYIFAGCFHIIRTCAVNEWLRLSLPPKYRLFDLVEIFTLPVEQLVHLFSVLLSS